MAACTFFGSSECPDSVYPRLLSAIEELIKEGKADTFYVGDRGHFDYLVQKALSELMGKYPVSCFIVLAYMPGERKEFEMPPLLETIYPEGLERTPPRFAINSRNRWMLNSSSYAICCPSSLGNSRRFTEEAQRAKKTVILL